MPKNIGKRPRTSSGASSSAASAPYSLASRDARTSSAKSSGQSASSASSANLIAPNTSLGQHFLKNPAVVTAIVAKAAIKPTDTVLEIGPGTGNMTVPLLAQSKHVIAIEYDPRMIREVLKRVEGTNDERKLQVVQGDAIKTRFPFFDVCVANVPYQISSALVFKLLSHRPMFRCAVMMFQEEFALRLTARPGEALYCRLSVNTQLLAKVDQLMKVGRNNFRPPPKVESRVVRIELRNPPPPVNFTEWDGMVRLLFNRKNKTLRSVLLTKPTIKLLNENMRTQRALNNNNKHNNNNHQSSSSSSSSSSSNTMMEVENIDAEEEKNADVIIEEVVAMEQWKDKRASKLDLDDFLALLAEFNKRGVHFA